MLVHTLLDELAAEVTQLRATEVTPTQWSRFLDVHVPGVDALGQALFGRALTSREQQARHLAAASVRNVVERRMTWSARTGQEVRWRNTSQSGAFSGMIAS